ncbi:MAG: MerR family transcriptional regulator [bacterium]|nr:MerR family transcriptional regulator [bacterium]
MFKIGVFAFLSRVPVKTLRYYDEIGLLKPAEIDPFTGYRYYTADQMKRLNRILVFKDLGLSLEQIKRLLDENLSTEQVVGMLRLRMAEVQQELQEGQGRLALIEAHIQQVQMEGKVSTIDVVLKKVEPQAILSMRMVIPDLNTISQHVASLYDRVYGFIQRTGVQPSGPALAIYHVYSETYQYYSENIDTECAALVNPSTLPAQIEEGITRRELEGYPTVASTLYKGPYTGITEAWVGVGQWIADNGYRIIGAAREIYLVDPGQTPNPADYLTEIQFPVEKI